MLRNRYTYGRYFLAVAFAALFSAQAKAQCSYACPPCNKETPLPGHGAAPDGTGRRIINVYIDSSWNSSGVTNPVIYNATQTAINQWNSATSCGSYTGYYFSLLNALGQGGGTADITIAQITSSLFCAYAQGAQIKVLSALSRNSWSRRIDGHSEKCVVVG